MIDIKDHTYFDFTIYVNKYPNQSVAESSHILVCCYGKSFLSPTPATISNERDCFSKLVGKVNRLVFYLQVWDVPDVRSLSIFRSGFHELEIVKLDCLEYRRFYF